MSGIGIGSWNLNSAGGSAVPTTGLTYDSIGLACSDETTQLTNGASKVSIRAPYEYFITGVTAYLGTTGSTDSIIDVNHNGSSLFSSAITIGSGSYYTFATNLSQTALTNNSIITVDIDSSGTGAKGLKIWLNGFRNQAAVGSLVTTGTGGGPSTGVVNGINTFTGGTFTNPSVNVTALTINTLTVSGATSLGTVSATTFVSGSTPFNTILNRYAYSSHTHNISDINNLLGSLNTKANLSGATFTGGVSAVTLSATTLYSGSTPLSTIISNIASGITTPSTFIQNGINTFTGGTTQFPTVNITAATLNNLTVTGTTSLGVLSATTIYSGGTNLSTIISNIVSNSLSGGTGTTGQFQKIYSSNDTWTAPAGVYSVVVELWGGGGGGGAGFGTASNSLQGGGGGASGAYILGEVAVIPGTTYSILIGSGGTPGYWIYNSGLPNSSVSAKAGGDSVFGNLIATGGTFGTNPNGTSTGVGGVAPYLTNFPSQDIVYQSTYFFTRGNSGANQTGVGGSSDSSGGAGGDTPIFGRLKLLSDSGGVGGITPNVAVSQIGGSASYFGGGGAGGTGYYLDGGGSKMGYSGGSGTAGLAILKWNAGSGTTFNYTNTFSGGTISASTNVVGTLTATTFYSGSTSFDTIFGRYAASSHTHSISDINNLQGSLNSKLSASATNISDVINLAGSLSTKIDLSATTISAPTLSGGTFMSGAVSFDTILNRYAYSSHTHNISDVNNLQGSLDSKINLSATTISAPTLSATTFTSGSTPLNTIFNRYAYSSHTHNISDINNLQGSLDSKINASGGTFTGAISAVTISAGTIYSGSTALNAIFAPKTLIMPYEFVVACSDETTQITTGTSKITFLAPCSFTLTGSVASLSSSGSTLTTANVKKANTTIYSTKVTIDANEFDSTTAATPPVITGSTWSQYDKITIDIDGAGTGAKGLKILFTGTRNITT